MRKLFTKYLPLIENIRRIASVIRSDRKMNSINSVKAKSHMNGNSVSVMDDIRKEYHNYTGGTLHLTKDDQTGIAQLQINSVERRNALSGTMMSELTDIITELEQWTQVSVETFDQTRLIWTLFESGQSIDYIRCRRLLLIGW